MGLLSSMVTIMTSPTGSILLLDRTSTERHHRSIRTNGWQVARTRASFSRIPTSIASTSLHPQLVRASTIRVTKWPGTSHVTCTIRMAPLLSIRQGISRAQTVTPPQLRDPTLVRSRLQRRSTTLGIEFKILRGTWPFTSRACPPTYLICTDLAQCCHRYEPSQLAGHIPSGVSFLLRHYQDSQ